MLKLSLLPQKYWSVSEKNGSQTFPLFFSWQICIWTLLTFLKKKNQHLWRAKERKKIVDNQKRHELSFFSHYLKEKKTNDSQKKKSNIWEQTKATSKEWKQKKKVYFGTTFNSFFLSFVQGNRKQWKFLNILFFWPTQRPFVFLAYLFIFFGGGKYLISRVFKKLN